MQKILILIGCPGSGKTEWAKRFLNQHRDETPRWQRISRDDIRMMCSNLEFDPTNEEYITEVEQTNVRKSLDKGFSVIVDATHVTQKARNVWHKLAQEIGNIEVIEHGFDVDLQTCIKRNNNRDRRVPQEIIENMFTKLQKAGIPQWKTTIYPEHTLVVFDNKKPDVIICDIDGTIADNSWRDVYDATRCDKDEPINEILTIINNIDSADVVFITGRDEKFRTKTMRWLQKYVLDPFELFMRPDSDKHHDFIVKEDIIKNEIVPKYNVLFAIDDRPSVCRIYRKLGIKTLQLNDIEF